VQNASDGRSHRVIIARNARRQGHETSLFFFSFFAFFVNAHELSSTREVSGSSLCMCAPSQQDGGRLGAIGGRRPWAAASQIEAKAINFGRQPSGSRGDQADQGEVAASRGQAGRPSRSGRRRWRPARQTNQGRRAAGRW
jgi:hypothetical protein